MDEIAQIKQKLNIVDVVSSYLDLKKAGRNYKGICPFHSENTPSFMTSPELQMFKCFGCSEAGDMFTFVQKIEGIGFEQAKIILAEKAGVKITKKRNDPNTKNKKTIFEINELTTKFYQHLLTKHKIGKEALKYVSTKRKLNAKTMNDFRVGFAPNTWDTLYKLLSKKGFSPNEMMLAGVVSKKRSGTGYIDKFRNRVMFPLIDTTGKVVGFTGRALGDGQPKYLNSQETLVFHKTNFIYGLDKAKIALKKEGAIFVEGQVDVLSAYQADIKNTVASSGTALTKEQLKILSRYTKKLILCFDPDTAGKAATVRAIELAEKEGFEIKVVIIPQKYNDLDDLITKDKREAVKIVKDPVSIYDFYIANAFKKFDKKSATGKNNTINEVALPLSKIKSNVVLEHYIKLLASELDIREETITKIIKNVPPSVYKKVTNKIDATETVATKPSKQEVLSTQEYILALLFNTSIDQIQRIAYKLGKKDFTNEQLQQIFSALKEYTAGRKRQIDIKYFSDSLDVTLGELVKKIYLYDLKNLVKNPDQLVTELDVVLKRLKKETITRELSDLKEKLRQAEMKKDATEIKILSEKVYNAVVQLQKYHGCTSE